MCDDELAEVTVPQIWAGVDIGKEHHHCVVVDERGERLLSRRVFNDEPALLELIADVLALSEDALWAVDINHGGAALLIGLLLSREQPMIYITGLAVHQASTAYRSQGKTDEKDAFVIADQARMRQDLGRLRPGDEIAVDLRTLTARRLDLVNDRTRQTNRLRAQLLEFFPALERALNLNKKGPVTLLTGYQVPAAIRRSGARRIGTWLKNRKVKNAAALAETAVEAARDQHIALPGETLAAAMVARIAKGPRQGDRRTRRAHRSPVQRAPARNGDPEPAWHGHPPRRRVRRRHRRRHGGFRHGRPPGVLRRPLTRTAGLRPRQRQHAPPAPLPSRPAPGFLPLRDGQPENLLRLPDLLRAQAERGERPQTSSAVSRPPQGQRLVGDDP